MRRTRRSGTRPEIALRRALHRRGLRFVVDQPVPGGNRRRRVDVLLRGTRIAIFVDGCFWHSCPEHRTVRPGPHRRRPGVHNRKVEEVAAPAGYATCWSIVNTSASSATAYTGCREARTASARREASRRPGGDRGWYRGRLAGVPGNL
ncbi:very short patch repair endonuclease [Amycolatopsis sp. NPDC058278]|uniref:very short patch repair endonuclease n=1 Tax=Amycolatopsis sp. NPDC058278 TaxID=3346417 RepID=UPI0036D9DF2D